VDGKHRLTYEPKHRAPVEDWLAGQKRFAHLLRPENRELVEQIQQQVDADWADLLARCASPTDR
jgi:pyruvate ferredoxin oxidoreductase beta subunit